MSDTAPVLELDRVEAGYGPFRALFGITFAVPRGTAVALVGPNGSGKSTVARVASGLVVPSAGRVLVEGIDRTGQPPHDYARAGIVHAPEGRSVFATLTVEENLLLAFRQGFGRARAGAAIAEAYELFPKLGERRAQTAGTLSGGEQRMLTLARGLVLRPHLLIADELTLGLAPMVSHDVYAGLARVRDAGTALLVVEQQLEHALDLADQVVVLTQGEITFSGTPKELSAHGRSIVPSLSHRSPAP